MTPKELVLFPGCALEGAGSEYGHSTLAVMEALGSSVRVLDDWNCCGATAARGIDPALSIRLSARNLALAGKEGSDLLVNCAACYNNLAYSRSFLQENPDARCESTCDASAIESTHVYHLLTILTSEPMLERLCGKITRPLENMRLACYYGCLLVRPGGYTQVDDPENPQLMDDLMRLCGAETLDWSYKTDCCGASSSLTNEEMALQMMSRIFEAAMKCGATALVTACPLCHMNLDVSQRKVGKLLGGKLSMPVYYFTELLALAMGLKGVRKWLKGHITNARKTLRECR
ncbi:MAG: CoB--CoM heterodisulfide reductase iron-sulfur subunit B family protein [Planctomycetota bacterium]|jgi:heterodisulfide reductase subunit B|nr:CoB--CoM heterodisulfide reductase iron-sulfur subunit B family protein [Planctomycetota bacterium]